MIDRIFEFKSATTGIRVDTVAGLVADLEGRSVLLVADENTATYVADSQLPALVLKSGESHKNWTSVNRILERAVALELGREAYFVGFGGGVVCDLTGFAASVYLRGCNLVLVPTTILAMVDASIGGKTGIDFSGYKNLVGTFYPAEQVHMCLETLDTLPEREYRSGLAEVVKHGLLGDEDLVAFLESDLDAIQSRRRDAVELCISRSLDIKGALVQEDLWETGVRAHLNLGHTFAHALEATTGFSAWSHGEAVAWGIDRAMRAGVLAGITDPDYADRVRKLLRMYGYSLGPLPGGVSDSSVLLAMRQDKKKKGGELQFVLQRSLGETLVTTLDETIVRRVLKGD